MPHSTIRDWIKSTRRIDTYILLSIFIALFVIAIALVRQVDLTALDEVPKWFHPVFFLYNLALGLVAILVVPIVTYTYVRSMRQEKKDRLQSELTEAELGAHSTYIKEKLERDIRFPSYFGSMLLMMIALALGTSIILLLKPTFASNGMVNGVNYADGANFLLLGPFIELYVTNNLSVYHYVIVGLTAFQFGFLGAYVYFITHLVRSYFTLDLTPHTYVDSAIRMAVGSIVSLVLSFILPTLPFFEGEDGEELFLRCLPVVAFFIGFFPTRGLMLMEKFGTRVFGLIGSGYNAVSLSELAGMSHAHEIRLQREGFDNLENLSHANAIDLALRTGFSYRQLKHWIGEAWLRVHLAKNYVAFLGATGIMSQDELKRLIYREDFDAAVAQLADDLEPSLARKVKKLCMMIKANEV